MTICNDLREAVLQAAMQGKLTQRLPSDGDTGELLEAIKAEREELIKTKKIKSEKSFSPITEDEIPFDIPNNWRWVRFGEIVNYRIGKTPPRAESAYWSDGIPWVSIADMPQNRYLVSTKEKISLKAFKEKFGGIISPAGTMLMSFKLTIGRVSILDCDAVHNEAIISIFPFMNEDNIMRDYLFKLLPFISKYGDFKSAIKGQTLNDTSIRNLLVPLPPLAEQKRIVAKIDELMAKIDDLEKTENELEMLKKDFPEDMKASILQAAMQGKLTKQLPSDGDASELIYTIKNEKEALVNAKKIKKEKPLSPINEDDTPFEIPESWKWIRLSEVGQLKNGYAFKSTEYTTNGIQIVRISDLGEDVIDTRNAVYYELKDDLAPYLIEKNSFLICMTGSIGKMAWVRDDTPRYLNQRVGMFVPNKICNHAYLWYFLHASHVVNGWIRAKTSTNGNIKTSDITELVVPLPPLAEQQRIVDKLEQLLPLCEILQERVD